MNLAHSHDKPAMIAAFRTLEYVTGYRDGLRLVGREPTPEEARALALRTAELTKGNS